VLVVLVVYLLVNLLVDLLYSVLNPQCAMDRNNYGHSSKQYTGPPVSSAANRTSLEARDSQTGSGRPQLYRLGVLITLCWVAVALLAPWIVPYSPTQGEAALLAPWIVPYSPTQGEAALAKGSPSLSHLFGLDKYGRDILTRVVYGSRYDLCIAMTVVGCSLVVGTCIGSISGFLGGKVDTLMMRVMDMLLAFPSFVLALVFVAVFRPTLMTLVIALSIRFNPDVCAPGAREIFVERVKSMRWRRKPLAVRRRVWCSAICCRNSLSPLITHPPRIFPGPS